MSKKQVNKKFQKKSQSKKSNSIKKEVFVDLEELVDEIKNNIPAFPIKCVLGSLTYELTEEHSKCHIAMYVSNCFESNNDNKKEQELLNIIFNKKYNSGESVILINDFERAKIFCDNNGIFDNIPIGKFITAEAMGTHFQNPKYNFKNDDINVIDDVYVAIHGQVISKIDNELLNFSDLRLVCNNFKIEGFVVKLKHHTVQNQICFKVKHKYFPSIDDPTKLIKEHSSFPDQTEFTIDGLNICDAKDYSHAVMPKINESIVIAEKSIKNSNAQLIVLPLEETIKKQLGIQSDNVNQTEHLIFEGEKMKNLFVATGQGPTYMYTDEVIPDVLNQPLELQLKFDGETIILHKDNNGKNHLMVKINVYVFLVEYPDGNKKYRFGWKK